MRQAITNHQADSNMIMMTILTMFHPKPAPKPRTTAPKWGPIPVLVTLWIVARALTLVGEGLHPGAMDLVYQPVTMFTSDLSTRLPSLTLCSNIRALGNPVKPSSVNLRDNCRRTHIMFIMLLLSGDIESNPGPTICGQATRKLADVCPCDAQVGWSEKGVLCDGCEIWFDVSCINVS